MRMFDGLSTARPAGERSNAAPQGDHQYEITRIEAPENLRVGPAYIVHYKILATTSPEAQIGGEYSWFQAGFAGHRDRQEAANGAVLTFLQALAGVKDGTPEGDRIKAAAPQIARASASAANPFAGMRGHAKTLLRPAKEPGKGPFLATHFYPLVPGSEGQADRMLAAAQQFGAEPPAPPYGYGQPAPGAYGAPPPPPVPGAYGAPPAPFLPPPQYAPPPAPGYAPPAPTASAPPPFVPPPTWPAPPPGYIYGGPGGALVPVPKV